MATPILNLVEVTAGQNQKEVTINGMVRGVEAAVKDNLSLNFTSGNITLTDAQFRGYAVFKCTNVTVARDLTVPLIKGVFGVDNAAGAAPISVKRGSATVVIAAGATGLLYTDGTTNGLGTVGATGAAAGNFVDLGLFYPGGPPASNELMLKFVTARDITFPDEFTGSFGHVGTNPTASFAMDVSAAGATIGTITISTGGVFTFTTVASGTTTQIAAGTVIEVQAPASTDATVADIAVTLAAILGLV